MGKLRHQPSTRVEKKREPRKAAYGSEVTIALIQVWKMLDYPCGQRLAPALRQEVERLRKSKDLKCSEAVGGQLREISPKTIDRLPARRKPVRGLRQNRD